jgi:yecA family protein
MTRTRTGGSLMKTFTQHDQLTDAELDRLADFLKSCKGGRAMNVEQLDGFFAALIAGPETVMPSEYYSEVFGGRMADTCEFGSLDEAKYQHLLTECY